MNLYIILLLLVTSASFASETPYDKFPASNNFTDRTIMVWDYADNVQAACESKSRELGNKGFGYAVDACSFRYKNKNNQHVCYVVTSKTVDMWTIGHEMRHCFQGEFHK